MSIVKITNSDLEKLTLVTTPSRHFSSSSLGVTGSVKVFPRRSKNEKETADISFGFSTDSTFELAATFFRQNAATLRSTGQSIYNLLDVPAPEAGYLQLVEVLKATKNEYASVKRFVPTFTLTSASIRKVNVKDTLMPYYRTQYPQANWAYTNYHSLNFFTAFDPTTYVQLVPTGSVLLYANVPDTSLSSFASTKTTGSYCLPGPFTFDFHINPRYKQDGLDYGHFRAGTIFHLSSSYALSLVTGTLKDENGLPQGFRLQLQLSHSADYAPSAVTPGNFPNDLIFLSDDNSLLYNNWHHVIVKWGTNSVNNGAGSFVIDGVERGVFNIPSSSVWPSIIGGGKLNPDMLCIGNFYEGQNSSAVGTSQREFFNQTYSANEGVPKLSGATTSPVDYKFRHPLKAEVHNLTILRSYLRDNLRRGFSRADLNDKIQGIVFHVPPFFIPSSSYRLKVPQSLSVTSANYTDTPFSLPLSYGIGAHYINLENFVKDFKTGNSPRLLNLSASMIASPNPMDTTSADDLLNNDGGVSKRNLTILPCDDGKFVPNYDVLRYENKLSMRNANSSGPLTIDDINLDEMVTSSSAGAQISYVAGKKVPYTENDRLTKQVSPLTSDLVAYGSTYATDPEHPQNNVLPPMLKVYPSTDNYLLLHDVGVQPGVTLPVYHRTRDGSSNQVVFFDISNMFYGDSILPGSFMIRDTGVSGSRGAVKITLRDNGFGSLYRSDSVTRPNSENSVGNIFYNEGVVLVKSPHLYFFGKNQYELSFKGKRNLHVLKYEVVAPRNALNSSSNPTYKHDYTDNPARLKPSGELTDNEPFVYISTLNFHDKNMNVIAKAKLAQPVIKREGDKILFKVAFDF